MNSDQKYSHPKSLAKKDEVTLAEQRLGKPRPFPPNSRADSNPPHYLRHTEFLPEAFPLPRASCHARCRLRNASRHSNFKKDISCYASRYCDRVRGGPELHLIRAERSTARELVFFPRAASFFSSVRQFPSSFHRQPNPPRRSSRSLNSPISGRLWYKVTC